MTGVDLALRTACSRHVSGNGPQTAADLLASIPGDTEVDRYGEGGVVAELESFVAQLLGKPAAVFLPSGTMAQGAVLRVHAARSRSDVMAWHPTCHLQTHEMDAYARLHGLVARLVGSAERLITLDDLSAIREPLGALLLELPQREIGGQLPSWTDLAEQVAWARERGIAVHLDGARLWEAAAGFDRSPAEVAALFDTVYVSFYKGIGALPGCCVAGSHDDVAQVREWRRRLGGTLYGLWPAAASALALLPDALAEMPARVAHARAIAEALRPVAGVRVVPDPPAAGMMHLFFDVTAEQFVANAQRLAQDGVWTWAEPMPTADPGVVRCELTVGRAACALDAQTVAQIIGELVH